MTGKDAESRPLFEFAVQHGPPKTAEKAKDDLERLDRFEAATELVAELAPD
jgi:hypothetical protein